MRKIIVKPEKLNFNNSNLKEGDALNMTSFSDDSAESYSSKLTSQYRIIKNVKRLLGFIKENKALFFLSISCTAMMSKIIYYAMCITDIKSDLMREAEAYANVREKSFVL